MTSLALLLAAAGAQVTPPILDVHLHASPVSETGEAASIAICAPFEKWLPWDPGQQSWEDYFEVYLQGMAMACSDPVWSAATDEEVMRQTVEIMERRNIYGVLSETPDRVQAWRAAAPGRFIPALRFNVGTDEDLTPDSLRQLIVSGQVEVFGEVWNWYDGIAPDDPRMEPYWALAEELDVPVAYHLNGGRPGEPHAGYGARARLVSALTMEEVLVRHPRLRVYLMHAGYPLLDDLLAVLYAHPQVYVDVGSTALEPRPAFYRYLQTIVEAGFGDRVMFGSDQMIWPGVIEPAIAVIEEAPFLSEGQKRDILYNNAARFLRLTEEEIARHHGR
jgi:predicted TIM-barrel fold metal-dependent hydrolase